MFQEHDCAPQRATPPPTPVVLAPSQAPRGGPSGAWPDAQGIVFPEASWLFSWDDKEMKFLVYAVLNPVCVMGDLSPILGPSLVSP